MHRYSALLLHSEKSSSHFDNICSFVQVCFLAFVQCCFSALGAISIDICLILYLYTYKIFLFYLFNIK